MRACAGDRAQEQLRRAVAPEVVSGVAAACDAAYHDGSGGSKSTAVAWWVRWRRQLGQQPRLMASIAGGVDQAREVEAVLCLWASWLRCERALTPRTVCAYVGTLMAWHERKFGPMMPLYEPVRLRAMLKGLRKLCPEGPKRDRSGVPTQALQQAIQRTVDWDDLHDVTLAAAASAAFCGLLRVGEYTSASPSTYDSKRQPLLRDCHFDQVRGRDGRWEVSATISIWPRKKGLKVMGKTCPVFLQDGKLVQPVALLRRMVALRKAAGLGQPGSPLFLLPGRRLVTPGVVTRYVRWLMSMVGEDPRRYSSHSLRIGGASAAFAAGVDETTIRALGRWDSETYRLYARMSRQVAMRLGRAVASTTYDV